MAISHLAAQGRVLGERKRLRGWLIPTEKRRAWTQIPRPRHLGDLGLGLACVDVEVLLDHMNGVEAHVSRHEVGPCCTEGVELVEAEEGHDLLSSLSGGLRVLDACMHLLSSSVCVSLISNLYTSLSLSRF